MIDMYDIRSYRNINIKPIIDIKSVIIPKYPTLLIDMTWLNKYRNQFKRIGLIADINNYLIFKSDLIHNWQYEDIDLLLGQYVNVNTDGLEPLITIISENIMAEYLERLEAILALLNFTDIDFSLLCMPSDITGIIRRI